MYELFQLVRLLSVRRECRRSGPVEIKQCAWRENGESSLLALLFSNGEHQLLLSKTPLPTLRRLLGCFTYRIPLSSSIILIRLSKTGTKAK